MLITLHAQSPETAVAVRAESPQRTTGELLQLLQQRQYLAVESALQAAPVMADTERRFFEGVLANRANRLDESVRLLAPLLVDPGRLPAQVQAKIAWRTLADTYTKQFRYALAADTYRQLLKQPGPSLSEDERNDAEGTRRMVDALRRAPAQTISYTNGFVVTTRRNALNTIEAPITVAGRLEHWILDTGANISIVTRSKARQLGLRLSRGSTPVHTFSGAVTDCHLAVIPSLRIGQAELRNVAVLVVEDKDFYIAPVRFQMQAILGYPVLAALGRITFHADGRFEARPGPVRAQATGARLLLEELTPLVVGGTSRGAQLFRLDTGATNSYLTVNYWRDHQDEFLGQKQGESQMDGGKGVRTIPSYTARKVILDLGGVQVTLRDVTVFARPHAGDSEYAYGHLGQNALAQFRSYTLDFGSMRFEVAP